MVHAIDEKTVTWEDFQVKFKNCYLNERYYDDKEKEFHELRLGQLTIDEFVTKFTNLLRYVDAGLGCNTQNIYLPCI